MNRRRALAFALGAVALPLSSVARAVAIIEFLQKPDVEQYKWMQQQQIAWLKAGYKGIPDNPWTVLNEMKRIALAKGYTYQSIDDVAKEAAAATGMTRAW